MPRKCCVAGCKANYGKVYSTVFQFPKDEERRRRWIQATNRDNFQPGPKAVICIAHFSPEFLILEHRATRDNGTELVVTRKLPKLTGDAYPTIFPNLPSNLSKAIKRKTPEERRKELKTKKVLQIAMAARESGNVTNDDNATDDITVDQDPFWTAVKEEVDVKPSSQTAFAAVFVKVEPVDCDGVSTSDDGQAGKVDFLLPPIEEVNVDPPPVKTEPNQEDPWGYLKLDILPKKDPLLLSADVKQEVKRELPSPESFVTSSYIWEEPDTDGADQWQLESVSYESDILTSIEPLLLPGKLEEEEGRLSLLYSAAGKEEVAEEQSCAEPVLCNIYQEEFKKKLPLRRHILMHSDCKRQSSNLRSHTKTHTGDKPHVCSVCSKHFTQSRTLKQHMFTHTGEKPHACSVCSKSFSQNSTLKQHMYIHTGERPHACSVCNKRFTLNSDLRHHMLTHTREKRHMCSVCSKCFTLNTGLRHHMLTHTGEKPHPCSVCSKRFKLSSTLIRHMLTHTGEKPHACSVCSRSFTQSNSLKHHMYTHTGEKPYQCSVCSKRFTQSSYLKQHVLSHTGEKPHACSVCSKSFTHSSNLKIHMFTHTGEKPHACSVCSKRFIRSNSLKKHMLSHT